MRITYVMPSTDISGRVKFILQQANWLAQEGWQVEIHALTGAPEWIANQVPVITYPNMREIYEAIKNYDGVKVATWWETAGPVFEACSTRAGGQGIPCYLVMDLEDTHYLGEPELQEQVRESYNLPMPLVTPSRWVARQLEHNYRRSVTWLGAAVDLNLYQPRVSGNYDRWRMVGYIKNDFLKNNGLLVEAARKVAAKIKGASLVTYGPESFSVQGVPHLHYHRPSNQQLVGLYSDCGVFLHTPQHEALGWSVLEAMACGAPVVTTVADGNKEICVSGWNCLVVESDAEQVAEAATRLLNDRNLASFLSQNALLTVPKYEWPRSLDRWRAFLKMLTLPT